MEKKISQFYNNKSEEIIDLISSNNLINNKILLIY
jgi:hypothetical protein